MTYSNQMAIDWSLSFVGYVEDENGNTPWSDRWGYPGGAWCGMFYESAAEAAGGTVDNDTGTIPYTHYTPDGARAFYERYDWHTDPEPSDAVYFDWGGSGLSSSPDFSLIDHIGRVVSTEGWPEYIVTVEGNISNSVVETVRYNNGQIVGFGRPKTDVAQQPNPTPQPQPEPVEVPFTEEDSALNIFVGGNGKGAWFMQAGGHLIPVSKGDVELKQRPAVNVIYCSDAFIQRLAKTLPVAR